MGRYPLLVIIGAFLSCFAAFNKCYAQIPIVSSFSPTKGFVGATVTISGSNFSPAANSNVVYFGAVRATIITASPTSLVVKVPAGATFQPISVLNTTSHLTGYSNYPFHVTFPSNGSITAENFDARVSFGTGTAPSCVIAADVDGDGKSDMIVANNQSESISIFRSQAVSGVINAASFAPKINIATGFFPSFVEAGDIDGDGRPDMVATNAASGTISLYKNLSTPGNIQFAGKVDIVSSPLPSNIKIADLDGDGKPDLAVTSTTSGNILSLYKNITPFGVINSGSFGPAIPIRTGFGFSYVNVADLDNDHKPELILTNAYTDAPVNLVYVYRNISNPGNLSAASSIICCL